MKSELEQLKQRFATAIAGVSGTEQLAALEQTYFSRHTGEVARLMAGLKDLPEEERKQAGREINDLKAKLEKLFSEKKAAMERERMGDLAEREAIDVTQPLLPPPPKGHLHPNTMVQRQLEDFFTSMGYMVLDGPELETDYYNFGSLNFSPDHPARDMQDTFAIAGHPDWLMRSQTSTMQVRSMRRYGAPLRAIIPGRCFRNESTDARHEHTFYQLEGFMIDRHITFAHMKWTLEAVAKHLYGEDTKLRLRPKYYPFVEPGVSGEITCFLCRGAGCRVCKHSGWLEIFGAGMIHPNVLSEGKIDPKKYQGFAFGLGLTRLVMLKYGIEDVRLLQSGDLRFLEQF